DGIRYFHVTGVQTCALPILEGVEGLLGVRLRQVGLAGDGRDELGLVERHANPFFGSRRAVVTTRRHGLSVPAARPCTGDNTREHAEFHATSRGSRRPRVCAQPSAGSWS